MAFCASGLLEMAVAISSLSTKNSPACWQVAFTHAGGSAGEPVEQRHEPRLLRRHMPDRPSASAGFSSGSAPLVFWAEGAGAPASDAAFRCSRSL